jgi:hypothetical protein
MRALVEIVDERDEIGHTRRRSIDIGDEHRLVRARGRIKPSLERPPIALDQLRFGPVARRVEAINQSRGEIQNERAVGWNGGTNHATEAGCFFAYLAST